MMPILDIEIVARPGETLSPNLAHELAHRAGEIFDSAPGGTWVKVHLIAQEHYAENSVASERFYPVFVSILKAKLPAPGALQEEITRLAAAIAEICGRPAENVHIIYLPEGAGRVAFGGKVVSG
jgi:phenylpyruvate tautomerase PptA (4-oxalocrotonate tautomerase family)